MSTIDVLFYYTLKTHLFFVHINYIVFATLFMTMIICRASLFSIRLGPVATVQSVTSINFYYHESNQDIISVVCDKGWESGQMPEARIQKNVLKIKCMGVLSGYKSWYKITYKFAILI